MIHGPAVYVVALLPELITLVGLAVFHIDRLARRIHHTPTGGPDGPTQSRNH